MKLTARAKAGNQSNRPRKVSEINKAEKMTINYNQAKVGEGKVTVGDGKKRWMEWR